MEYLLKLLRKKKINYMLKERGKPWKIRGVSGKNKKKQRSHVG